MDFNETLRQFASEALEKKQLLKSEESTKTSLIMPFFHRLGYDVFSASEFIPEYVADFGIKKGEKVDYAIMKDDAPVILIEAKWCGEDLNTHVGQLYRYFSVTPSAKFGILTNGIEYQVYTDLEIDNQMDPSPFFKFSLAEFTDNDISGIKKFRKDDFSVEKIKDFAFESKYSKLFKNYIISQIERPTDDFIKFILGAKINDTKIYDGTRTVKDIERFKLIVQKVFADLFNEAMIEEELPSEITEITEDKTPFLKMLESAKPEIQNIYQSLKGYASSLGNDIAVYEHKTVASIKKNNKTIVWIELSAITIRLYISTGRLRIQNIDDFEKAKPLIEKAYNET